MIAHTRIRRRLSAGLEVAMHGRFFGLPAGSGMLNPGGGGPPPPTDPDWLLDELLLHFDGSNGSTAIYDETGRICTAEGAAQISTSWSAFGGSSLYLSGATGTRVAVPGSTRMNPGTADFSFQGRFRPGALPTSTNLTALASTRNNQTNGWALYVNSSGYLRLLVYTGSVTPAIDLTASSGALAVNTEYVIEWSRQGTTWRIFVDGVVVASTTSSANTTGAYGFHVGWDGTSNSQRHFTGYVDEIRITRGLARNTANYSPDTEAFWYPQRMARGGWTWFNDPRGIYAGSNLVLGAMTVDGEIASFQSTLPHAAWTMTPLKTGVVVDDHNNPAFLKRSSDNKLLAMYSAHNGSGYYGRISSAANSATAWGTETNHSSSLGGGPYSYANLFQMTGMSGSPVYAFMRRGSTPSWTTHYAVSTDEGVSFGAATALLSAGRPYLKAAQNGSTRIDFACTDGQPDEVSTNSIRHFYFDNGSWYDSAGTNIGSPPFATTTDLTTVYDGTSKRAWIWDIRIGSDGHPRIVFAKFESTTDHRYCYARWTGSAWSVTEICAAGTYLYSGEPYYSGGVCLDPEDPNIVYASRESGGVWRLYKYVTADGGSSFTETLIRGDVSFIRPYAIPGSGKLAALCGTYTSYTNYDMRIMLFDR